MDLDDIHSTVNEEDSATENGVHIAGPTSPLDESVSYSPQSSCVGWDGTIMRSPQSCSDPSSSPCQSPSGSGYSDFESLSHFRYQNQESDGDENEDTDPSVDENPNLEGSAEGGSLHQQKAARAISSKYRYGPIVGSASKYFAIASKMRMKVSKLAPGVLVWALLPAKHRVPWWPGIIVGSRLIKRGGKDVRHFRIILIYPPPHLEETRSFFVTEERLRILKTREAFEDFMQSSLKKALTKLSILSNFIVPSHCEQIWLLAREKMLDMEATTQKSLTSRLHYLHLDLARLRKIWNAEDAERKEKLIKPAEKSLGLWLCITYSISAKTFLAYFSFCVFQLNQRWTRSFSLLS